MWSARRLGVSTETLRRWGAEGRLTEVRTAGGHRRYLASDIERLSIGLAEGTGLVIGYARVSSHDQKASGDLGRQIERLKAAGAEMVFTDVGSGLSETRAGLTRLLNRVAEGHIDRVLVVTRDRLARFGTSFIEVHLASHDAALTVLDPEDRDISPDAELVSDLLALVASFSGRLYGLRSARRRALEQSVSQAVSEP
jgi:putative resolvase